MRSPHGIDIVDCCSSCRLRTTSFFCNFSTATLQHFDHITFASAFPSGAVLKCARHRSGDVVCGFFLCLSSERI